MNSSNDEGWGAPIESLSDDDSPHIGDEEEEEAVPLPALVIKPHWGACVPRVSVNRAPALVLASDPIQATADVLALINGTTAFDRSSGIETARLQVLSLANGDSTTMLQGLASQAVLLDAMWRHFITASMEARQVDARTRFAKTALQCQLGYSRVLAEIDVLSAKKQAQDLMTVDDESGEQGHG